MFSYGFSTSYIPNTFAMPVFYTPSYSLPSFSVSSFGGFNSIFGNYGSLSPTYTQIQSAPKTETVSVSESAGTSSGYSFGSLTGTLNKSLDIFSNIFSGSFTQILPKPTLTFKANPISTTTISTTTTSPTTFTPTTFTPTSKYTGTNATVQNALELAYKELKLGVREENKNDSKAIRKYKNGVQNSYAWCGYFVSWLYGNGQNRNNKNTFGYEMNSQRMRKKAEKAGFFAPIDSGYKPKPGDIMVLTDNYKTHKKNNTMDDAATGHVGIVTKVNSNGSFETIEGNYSDKVSRVPRKMNNPELSGFIRMEDWLNSMA